VSDSEAATNNNNNEIDRDQIDQSLRCCCCHASRSPSHSDLEQCLPRKPQPVVVVVRSQQPVVALPPARAPRRAALAAAPRRHHRRAHRHQLARSRPRPRSSAAIFYARNTPRFKRPMPGSRVPLMIPRLERDCLAKSSRKSRCSCRRTRLAVAAISVGSLVVPWRTSIDRSSERASVILSITRKILTECEMGGACSGDFEKVAFSTPVCISIQSNPIQSNPINPIQSNPIQSNPIQSNHQSNPIQSNPIESIQSNPINPIQSNPIQSNPIQSSIQSNPINPIQSNLINQSIEYSSLSSINQSNRLDRSPSRSRQHTDTTSYWSRAASRRCWCSAHTAL